MKSLVRIRINSCRINVPHARRCSWISKSENSDFTMVGSPQTIEKVFTNDQVQRLLLGLISTDLTRIYDDRMAKNFERSHYALMTDKMLDDLNKKMQKRAANFFQLVPFKEPCQNDSETLSSDNEIDSFDTSKFIFTDISYDTNDQNRTVVVREPNGILRTATPEEHNRMNRIYYNKLNRPVKEPAIFSSNIHEALKSGRHEFIMDLACHFFEPNDPRFVEVSIKVFNWTVEHEEFDLLHSTRHFGTLAFYLILNRNMIPLVKYFLTAKNLKGVADLIRLDNIVHSNRETRINVSDEDYKIVKLYFEENADGIASDPELEKLFKDAEKFCLPPQ